VREAVRARSWWGNLRDSDYLKHVGVDRRIFKWVLKKYDGVLDWIDLAQYNIQMGLQEIRWRLGLD
jgi:hypothetical protein